MSDLTILVVGVGVFGLTIASTMALVLSPNTKRELEHREHLDHPERYREQAAA